MDVKRFGLAEVKTGDRGEVSAVFSTFNVVDSDGDVTVPGAFEDGAEVVISSYGHTSWSGSLPVGKGVIRSTDTEAIMDGQFFMDTAAGRDTFTVVKRLGPMGQWSYGYDVLDSDRGMFAGTEVRFLKRLHVHETSPVLIGAGVNVRTLDAKSGAGSARPGGHVGTFKIAIRPHETPVSATAWDSSAVVAGIPDGASVSDLRSVYAWVDPSGDPEAKSSYRFPHHQGVGGAANVRACISGIAVLNGARGGAAIPDGDREGVYRHLVAHLTDADREAPELRGRDGGELKLHDELAVALVEVANARESASRVGALRAAKGKTLSRVNSDLLEWLYDELRGLRTQIDSPGDDLAREYVRFVATQQMGAP